MNRITVILLALIVSTMTFAAGAVTNVSATAEKCTQSATPSAGVLVTDAAILRELKAEVKEAAAAAEAQYEKRYYELKGAHDRFMDQVNILVAILGIVTMLVGVAAPIVSYFREKDWKKELKTEVQKTKHRFEEIADFDLQFRRMQGKQSFSAMKFEWVEFLHVVQSGNAKTRDIAQPLYRTVETLVLANKLGDTQYLNECVKDIADIISNYREIVKDKSDLDKTFKDFVREKGICADSINFNYLTETLGGKTSSLDTVLKFLNEFGITMFGEVS